MSNYKRLHWLWNISQFLPFFITLVRNQFIPCTTSVDESQRGRVRPGGGWADVGSRVAAPAACLRVLPTVPRISRLSTQHGQTIYRPSICFAGGYLFIYRNFIKVHSGTLVVQESYARMYLPVLLYCPVQTEQYITCNCFACVWCGFSFFSLYLVLLKINL